MVLSLIALRQGDKDRAKEHLLASARTEGFLEMNISGPNLALANELLKLGERDAVAEYLGSCRAFWSPGRATLDKWIDQLRAGEDPDFAPSRRRKESACRFLSDKRRPGFTSGRLRRSCDRLPRDMERHKTFQFICTLLVVVGVLAVLLGVVRFVADIAASAPIGEVAAF
jgi:hypothetical protein